MELNYQHGYIEELLALRRDAWETIPSFPTEMGELFSNGWNLDCFDDNPAATLPPISFHQGFSSPLKQDFNNYYLNEVSCPFGNEFSTPPFTDEFSAPQITDSSYNTLDMPSFPVQEDTPMSTMEDDHDMGLLPNHAQSMEMPDSCKVEPIQSPEMPVFNIGSFPERKMRGKKLEGQPSKNLMAERRRRKRLNERLSMLRSIVPKISKMDRTSILGDTIDYVKELLERIQNLQQEIEVGSDQLNMMGILKDTKSSEFIVRNSPKFDVERVNEATRIEICCASKPGLLLSTVNTLETLGLEIQQCVISCFNDFAMQASCSEELEQRRLISSEDIKQALFRGAGYGGRCL
ncbi:hypothetical protein P3X46_021188 [Hevea brasiliensis]|uniref:BHLH domain-containing protein n=1 Tax=Hevea brasiliensis TaxID=3981 RepID=A0ABQ9LGN5_HEVBR|nr:transcription factor bHLH93 [Hevea brasiliensis]KAJ9166430.1 hypothetical protein P3X46_021188 [Hevea brasiliensis]